MLKRGSPMNPVDVLNVEQLEKHNGITTVTAGENGKCIQPPAQIVVVPAQYLSNLALTGQFIAGTVISHATDTKTK